MVDRAIVLLGTGVFIGLLGVLIRYAGMGHLIAGYDPDRVDDAEGLSDFVGAWTLVVAVLTAGVGVLELWEPTADAGWYWLVFVVAVLAVAVWMVRGARRYDAAADGAE